jgi:integrase
MTPARVERRQRWSTFKRRKDAENALNEILAKQASALDPWPKDMTVSEYLDQWMERHANRIRPRTAHRYREHLDLHLLPQLGEIKLAKLRPIDIQRVLDDMPKKGASAGTVIQARAVLGRAMAEAVRGELLPRNPVAATQVPRAGDPGLTVLLPEHVEAVLAATKKTLWEIALILAGWTGARRSEVLALRWSDLDLEAAAPTATVNRTLQVRPKDEGGGVEFGEPKTAKSRRTIRLAPTVVTALKAHKASQAARQLALGSGWQDGDLVCDRGDGGPLHPDAMTAAFRRLAKKAKLPDGARLHDLRHAVAVTLMLEHVPLKGVSATLGHASETFTAGAYQHVVDELQEQVVDALERRLGRSPGASA